MILRLTQKSAKVKKRKTAQKNENHKKLKNKSKIQRQNYLLDFILSRASYLTSEDSQNQPKTKKHQKKMKFTKIALIVATLFMAAATQDASYDGCIGLLGKACSVCFRRKRPANGNGCGPLLPKNDTCDIYGFNKSPVHDGDYCVTCKAGYTNKVTFNNGTLKYTCVPGAIQDCINEYETVNPGNTFKLCDACKNGKYAVLDEKAKTSSCQTISDPVPNCLIGGIDITNSPEIKGKKCYRCKPGYAADGRTGQCAPATQKGCWLQLKGRCYACDPYQGYSMNQQGQCYKSDSEESTYIQDLKSLLAGNYKLNSLLAMFGN